MRVLFLSILSPTGVRPVSVRHGMMRAWFLCGIVGVLLSFVAISLGRGAPLYWDANGAVKGAGNTGGSGAPMISGALIPPAFRRTVAISSGVMSFFRRVLMELALTRSPCREINLLPVYSSRRGTSRLPLPRRSPQEVILLLWRC